MVGVAHPSFAMLDMVGPLCGRVWEKHCLPHFSTHPFCIWGPIHYQPDCERGLVLEISGMSSSRSTRYVCFEQNVLGQ